MKAIEVVDVSSVSVLSSDVILNNESRIFIDENYDKLILLAGTSRGIIVDLNKANEDWPTVDQMKCMPPKEKGAIALRVHRRMRFVFSNIRDRKDNSIMGKYHIKCTYIGNGRVILWWKSGSEDRFSNKRRVNKRHREKLKNEINRPQ